MPFILDGMASLCCAASLEKQRFSAFALLTLLSWSTICLTLKGRGNALLRGSYLSYNEGESVLRSIA